MIIYSFVSLLPSENMNSFKAEYICDATVNPPPQHMLPIQ